MLEQALSYPKQSVSLDMSFQNIMSVEVPKYTFRTQNDDPSEIFPYGFAQTSGELDDALEALSGVFQDMLELAQVEKTMQLLASEIEKTRRRVNALEYVMIPEMETNIKYISMKLDENERSSTIPAHEGQGHDAGGAASESPPKAAPAGAGMEASPSG